MAIIEKIAELTRLPKELICGSTGIKITSEKEMSIENHHGLVSYSTTQIVFSTKNGKCLVSGKHLMIEEISEDELYLKGIIKSVEFL